MIRIGFILLGLLLLGSPADGQAAMPIHEDLVYYEGVIMSINHEEGELVLAGTKEGVEGDVVVQLTVDPEEVYVTTPSNQYLEFRDLQRGDRIDVDGLVQDGRLIVDTIFVYTEKPDRD